MRAISICALQETGTAKHQSFYHKPCWNAQRQLERKALAIDKSKNSKVASQALTKFKTDKPSEYKKQVLKLVVEEGERAGAAQREQAAELVDAMVKYAKMYSLGGVVILPKKAFLAHMKFVEGLDDIEAVERWDVAWNDPMVPKEADASGALGLPVHLRKRYLEEEGTAQETHLKESRVLVTDEAVQSAQRRMRSKIVPNFRAQSGHHYFKDNVAVLPSAHNDDSSQDLPQKTSLSDIQWCKHLKWFCNS